MLMHRNRVERAAIAAKWVEIDVPRFCPADKLNAKFERALCRLDEVILVQPKRLVKQLDGGNCRLTDPDDADLAASFCRSLKRFGFTHIEARTVGSEPQFVYISAQKSAEPESGAELSFGEPAAETVMLAA